MMKISTFQPFVESNAPERYDAATGNSELRRE